MEPRRTPKKRKKTLHKRLDKLVGEMVEGGIRLEDAVRELETLYLRRVLDRTDGNQTRAAELLGIHRNTLRKKLRRCGLL